MTYSKTKKDNYQEITNSFIEAIESCLNGDSQIPSWVRPWSSVGSPRNGFSNRPYQGMNSLLLSFKASMNGYADNRWATYNQIKKEGGQVTKGEKGTQVIMWRFIEDKKNKGKTIPLLRVFTVFNVNGQSSLELPTQEIVNQDERLAHCEEVFNNVGAIIKHGGDKAFFSPSDDYIGMPTFESFKSASDYYATLAHELIHWTGHESRLDRQLNEGRFGNEAYAFEELVAELGSSFICQDLGIDGKFQDNHLAYLKSWLKVLKNDTKAIFRASSLAKVATKEILPQEETHEDEEGQVLEVS
jgi:antirestriction protein ArdC